MYLYDNSIAQVSRQNIKNPFWLTIFIFATSAGVVDTGGEHGAASIFANFRQKSK